MRNLLSLSSCESCVYVLTPTKPNNSNSRISLLSLYCWYLNRQWWWWFLNIFLLLFPKHSKLDSSRHFTSTTFTFSHLSSSIPFSSFSSSSCLSWWTSSFVLCLYKRVFDHSIFRLWKWRFVWDVNNNWDLNYPKNERRPTTRKGQWC